MKMDDLSHVTIMPIGKKRLSEIDNPRWYRQVVGPDGTIYGPIRVSRDPYESIIVQAEDLQKLVETLGEGVRLEWWIGNPLPVVIRTIICNADEIVVGGGVECTSLDYEAIRARANHGSN
jgi:hypothetical protein